MLASYSNMMCSSYMVGMVLSCVVLCKNPAAERARFEAHLQSAPCGMLPLIICKVNMRHFVLSGGGWILGVMRTCSHGSRYIVKLGMMQVSHVKVVSCLTFCVQDML